VDELFDDDPRGHQMNQSQKGLAQFLIPGRHAAKLCELVEEPFHLLASLIAVVVILSSGCPMALGWYHWPYVMGKALLANAMAVIALVHHRKGQRWRGRPLGEPHRTDGTFMTGACREP